MTVGIRESGQARRTAGYESGNIKEKSDMGGHVSAANAV